MHSTQRFKNNLLLKFLSISLISKIEDKALGFGGRERERERERERAKEKNKEEEVVTSGVREQLAKKKISGNK